MHHKKRSETEDQPYYQEEHLEYLEKGYLDRLAENWPQPREQLQPITPALV
jgi:hypothetical protein